MSMQLLQSSQMDEDAERLVARAGEPFVRFVGHDSGCVSFGIVEGDRRLFVKYAQRPGAQASLWRAVAVNRAVEHEALPQLLNVIETRSGPVLVYEWVDGELLREQRYESPDGAVRTVNMRDRFRTLPVEQILAALDVIYDVHLRMVARGFVAVDFYDGCILYDFERQEVHLCDLDEYRPGPFVLAHDRLPGSTRFMAPEEWVRGSAIDQVTNVYNLGRAALVLLGDGTLDRAAWKGSEGLLEVVMKAVSADREARHGSVAAFVEAWREVAGSQ